MVADYFLPKSYAYPHVNTDAYSNAAVSILLSLLSAVTLFGNTPIVRSGVVATDTACCCGETPVATPTPTPSNVLLVSAEVSDSYVQKDFGENPEVWLTFDLGITADMITFWNETDGASGVFANMIHVEGSYGFYFLGGADQVWNTFYNSGGTPVPAIGWQTCEWHYVAPSTLELYVGGSLAVPNVLGPEGDNAIGVQIGQQITTTLDPRCIAYVRNVKIGTTRGASDIFADDFSSGNLSAWSSIVGDCSIVPDPFP